MSATATPSKTDRAALLAPIAEAIRDAATQFRAAGHVIGSKLNEAYALFPASEVDVFWTWASNVTGGWSKSQCRNMMDAATVLEGLTKPQREKVQKWPAASITSLVPALKAGKSQLRQTVSAVKGTNPQPELVRDVRDGILAENGDGTSRTPRVRETDADRTAKLAGNEEFRKIVERNAPATLKDGTPNPSRDEQIRLMVVGAQLALSDGFRPARLVPDAIRFVAANPVAATDDSK